MACIAVIVASAFAAAANAATLKIVLSDNSVTTYLGVDYRPTLTLYFANDADYSGMALSDVPKFGQADFVKREWTDTPGLGFEERNPAFVNPPFPTERLADTVVTMGEYNRTNGFLNPIGIFSATGAFGANARIVETLPDEVGVRRTLLRLAQDSGLRFDVFGHWDDDGFDDTGPVRLYLDAARTVFDPTATGFGATDPVTPVPVPAAGALLASGLAGLAALRRRRRRN